MNSTLLSIRQLRKTYGAHVQALRGVDLEVRAGETLAVVGESGCGKSTLARHLLKLEAPTAGEIQFGEKPISQFSQKEIARSIQMIFQDPASSLNPRRKVKDIIAEPLRVQGGASESEIRQKVAESLANVGLRPEMAERYPHMFSGGQKQRIGIARALVTSPKLLICDEPVSALDVSVQAQVLNLLLDLQDQKKLAYLFISHDLSVVRFLADRVAVMYLGRIVEQGPVARIFSKPRHPYTRMLMDSTPAIGQDATESTLKVSELPSPANPPPGCAFAARCRWAIDRCRQEMPELEGQGEDLVACHRAAELNL